MTDDLVAGPLSLHDIPALLGLFHRYDRRYFGEPLMEDDDLQAELAEPDLDLAADTLGLRTPDGVLVAGGFVTPRGLLEVKYAEGWDSPELQRRLVDFGEDRGRERGLDAVFQFLADADTEGAERLLGRGYRLAYTAWILRLDPETPIRGRELPPGYAVRPFTLDDAEATFAVVRDAFGEWDTAPERTFESWRAHTLGRPHVDPSAFRVATYQGKVIGAAIVFDSADEAWVAQLAVARPHRGRGVAQQLLADTYAAARSRGLSYAGLSTDTRTGALDLYRRLGMRVLFTLNNYNLALRG
ncbi:MAG TPA: GNAT family N-acetyltransferase [Propionibacteriaceae bacterium]|nr:GNAT family N-acetyltransferase [Propionibacteriaceae bacterium]